MHQQKSFTDKKATLFLVPTPIGNLSDMTLRAIETLKTVSVIFAEDTRTSGVLLKHYEIKTSLKSFHMHNEAVKQNDVIRYLQEGQDCALISDAGMPLVSDPGQNLVKAVKEAGFYVVALPGASASLTALVVSGIETHPFTFYGFLPSKSSARKQALSPLKTLNHTLIFYEAPHRIHATLDDLSEVFGDREVCIARELTKRYEEVITLRLDERAEVGELKGEIVLIVEGFKETKTFTEDDMIDHIELLIADGMKEMDAIKQVAKLRNMKKNTVYMAYQTHKKHFKNDQSEDGYNG